MKTFIYTPTDSYDTYITITIWAESEEDAHYKLQDKLDKAKELGIEIDHDFKLETTY